VNDSPVRAIARALKSSSYARQQRRRGQQYERHEQRLLAEMLTRLIPPGTAYWTAIENKPRNAVSGMYQRLAGVKSGFPDVMVLRCDKPPIFLELKSLSGTLSKVQRQVRLELLAHGARWFMARSAMGALVALYNAGVELRSLNGRRWEPPELEPWQEPVEDPSRPHPAHPDLRARRREAKRRQRAAARQRLQLQQASGVHVADSQNDDTANSSRLTAALTAKERT